MWCYVLALCVASVLAEWNEDHVNSDFKRDTRGMCYTSEGWFHHGEIVSTRRSPCLKYRCEFSNLRLMETSCPYEGKCHRVGSSWPGRRDCHTYTCVQQDFNSYRIDRVQSGCKDAYGKCHRPGDVFAYPVHGRIYRGCTCTATTNLVKYQC